MAEETLVKYKKVTELEKELRDKIIFKNECIAYSDY